MIRKAGELAIPVALVGVLISLLIWLSEKAVGAEHRLTSCEARVESIREDVVEIRDTLREIRATQREILGRLPRKEAP